VLVEQVGSQLVSGLADLLPESFSHDGVTGPFLLNEGGQVSVAFELRQQIAHPERRLCTYVAKRQQIDQRPHPFGEPMGRFFSVTPPFGRLWAPPSPDSWSP